MSETFSEDEAAKLGRRGLVLLAAGTLIAATGAFAAGYLGLVSPRALLMPATKHTAPEFVFIDMPRIIVPMAGRDRQLVLGVKLEAAPGSAAEIEILMPRVLDSFNRFLSDIDPAAIDRRGVLEIIRFELQSRVQVILGPDAINEILITEFAVQ